MFMRRRIRGGRCVNKNGKTLKEVTENIEVIIHEWIECALEVGEAITYQRAD